MRFGILGPIEVVTDDGPMRLGGPRQRATLALLLLNANRVVSIEQLAETMYAGRPPVTAVTQVQRQISELRKALGAERIYTETPGYVIRVSPDELDLTRFERATAEGADATARGDARGAVASFEEALALWRGQPLADLGEGEVTLSHVRRLEELRLAAHERLLEAELALGRHSEVAAALEPLVVEHPLRESLCALQMLALYRSGRQAEALEVFRRTRAELVERFGIEPGAALRELERAILRQDPSLERASPPVEEPRVVMLLGSGDRAFDRLLALAVPLVGPRELILTRLVTREAEVGPAAAALNEHCRRLGGSSRAATFTSADPAEDAAQLIDSYAADLVLVDSPEGFEAQQLPKRLAGLFERSQADVGVVVGVPRPAAGIYVPFGGSEHDWAALELATELAASVGAELVLVGTAADKRSQRRDASRLLANAGLAAQRLAGVQTRPVLAALSPEALRVAVSPAGVVVTGIGQSWRGGGIGPARRALVASGAPLVLVHRGPRPGGLAPRESRSRFTWTLDYSQGVSD